MKAVGWPKRRGFARGTPRETAGRNQRGGVTKLRVRSRKTQRRINRALKRRERNKSRVLTALAEQARAYGWEGDFEEVARFVRWCHERAGAPPPDLDLEPST